MTTCLFTSHKYPLGKLPLVLFENIKSWISLNNDECRFMYYSDNSIDKWFDTHYPAGLQYLSQLNSGAGRADYFRICRLSIMGGIWVDADLPAFKLPRDVHVRIKTHKNILFENRRCHNPRYTMIYSSGGDPFFLYLRSCIERNIKVVAQMSVLRRHTLFRTIEVTGPFVMHKVIMDLCQLDNIERLKPDAAYTISSFSKNVKQTYVHYVGQLLKGPIKFAYMKDVVPPAESYQAENTIEGYNDALRQMSIPYHSTVNAIKRE